MLLHDILFMLGKIKKGIKRAYTLHKVFGVSYITILMSLPNNHNITVPINGIQNKMRVRTAMYLSEDLYEIERAGWKIKNDTGNNSVIFENGKIRLYADSIFYADTINEIFIKEIYKANVKDKVVIDVGAYFGESSIYFALQGAKKVIALEPDEESYKIALRNIKENGLENKITLLNKAISPTRGIVNYYRTNSAGTSSTAYDQMIRKDEVIVKKQVEAITLDEIIANEGEIGLLKMDCEGCEYSVLNSFSHFDKTDEIVLEYHKGLQNLPSLLKSYGFVVTVKKERGNRLGILKAKKRVN